MQFSDRPIFILGAHKSGTSLLRNLLDGHPELFAVPIETHFPHCMGLPACYPRRMQVVPGDRGKAARMMRMLEIVKGYNGSDDKRADNYLPGRFDQSVFTEHLQRKLTDQGGADDLGHYLDAVMCSLGMAIPEGTRHFVEKSVDNIEHARWLKQLFPQARFLFIVRHPQANLVSFRKFIQRNDRFPSLVQPIRTLEFAFHHAVLYNGTLPDMHLLRYEDLTADPRKVMEEVAGFLQIKWSECLLHPTSMGESWTGNSTTGRAMQGVSAEHLERWRSEIEPVETGLIERSSLSALMPLFGYHIAPKKGFWRMAKGEGFTTYLRNRIYRIFADGS
ncbi:MAG: sulfotransferase [Flavobacteriales bacterium]